MSKILFLRKILKNRIPEVVIYLFIYLIIYLLHLDITLHIMSKILFLVKCEKMGFLK